MKKRILPLMGFLNKVMFWKKHDELDLDELADKEMTRDISFPRENAELGQPTGFEERSPFEENSPALGSATQLRLQPAAGNIPDKDLELISSKLDTIKAMLDSVEQRLSSLEQAAGIQRKQRLW